MSHPPLARALGRIPSGLFVVTTVAEGGPLGFLGSFVQQVGFAPPTVAVAVATGREHLAAMRASRCFGVSVLDAASKHAMPPFFGKLPAGVTSPFEVLTHRVSAHGPAVLTDALAWVVCKVTGEHAVGDHVVVFGEVVEGELLREGEPSVHLRKNGLSY
jgi:flavin reductase (DIM6/NTAB) family NADH-FMN oxidoreductase RutF